MPEAARVRSEPVAFRAWTDDGKLRHASFKGLREDEDAADMLEIVD